MLLLASLFLPALPACASSDDGPPPTPAETIALYDNLPAPTPNVLRGVWSSAQTAAAGTTDTRFRFADGKVIGGVRCTSSANLTAPFIVGQIGTMTTSDLDQMQGQLVIPAALGFTAERNGVTCTGVFSAATWSFVITDKSMVISAQGIKGGATFTKVGD